ncbi:PREDICTED: elongation factor Ts, mitochondrial [Calidris pugnax]|uniref:elongation factor Ts, mitochondrial n=1 Tax=Calidris pugnax TaxID=198806 RepID=UPI00071CD043|nr:PREDICTED: elongation factor Ts, mitochondrial [Calidris pugnax]
MSPPCFCVSPPCPAPPQAEAWLQEEAQRQGWSRAVTLRDRRAREGLVGLLREGTNAVLVELNCETDFVAKTAEFQRGLTLSPLLPPGKLGEKLALRRAAWLRVPRASGFIGVYSHGGLAAPPAPVAMGTYGALVACEVTEPRAPEATLEDVGRKVAQHVVGLAPREVGTPQDELGGEEESRLLAQGFLLEPELSVGQFLRRRGVLSVTDFLRFRCGEETHGEPHGGEGTRVDS